MGGQRLLSAGLGGGRRARRADVRVRSWAKKHMIVRAPDVTSARHSCCAVAGLTCSLWRHERQGRPHHSAPRVGGRRYRNGDAGDPRCSVVATWPQSGKKAGAATETVPNSGMADKPGGTQYPIYPPLLVRTLWRPWHRTRAAVQSCMWLLALVVRVYGAYGLQYS